MSKIPLGEVQAKTHHKDCCQGRYSKVGLEYDSLYDFLEEKENDSSYVLEGNEYSS